MDIFEQIMKRQSMTYSEYQEFFRGEVARVKAKTEVAEQDSHDRALPLNAHRTQRIEKTYSIGKDLLRAIENITQNQIWLILTEPWCGDSAQCLPYIAKIAGTCPLVEMRILLRDQNLEIMDQYLTRGTRSIPKLIAFDRHGQEIFRWGPRPKEAMELFLKSREAGTPQEKISEKLHLWYGRNRGQAIELEFLELLNP